MPIPKYYVRPDGLHESIITVNGKRKAFRGKTDREVWNKIKAYRAEAEKPKTVPFSDVVERDRANACAEFPAQLFPCL